MKQLLLSILLAFCFLNAQSQVSNTFYNYFNKSVQENKSNGKDFYTALSNALTTCINLKNENYYAEIKAFHSKGISDSAAISMIPTETLQRFFEEDFEMLFCPNAAKNKRAMELYANTFCQIFTEKYEKIEKRERNKQEQVVVKESMTELVSNQDFVKKMKEVAAGMDAVTLQVFQEEIFPYVYFDCPLLKSQIIELPTLLSGNNLRQQITNQKWLLSNTFKYAIEHNAPDTLKPILLTNTAFAAINKNITSHKNEIEKYNRGTRLNNIEWPNASTIIQTFATVEKDQNITIHFQFIYHYKQIATRLFLDAITYHPAVEIKNKLIILEKLKNQLNPPPELLNPN